VDEFRETIRARITLKRRSDAVKVFMERYADGLEMDINEELLRSL
jgi:hypothetical protein